MNPKTARRYNLAFYGLYFFFFLGIGVLLPYLFVFLRESRGMSEPAAGVAALLAPLSVMLMQPLWGTLADLLGRPVLLIQLASLGATVVSLVMWQRISAAWYFLLVPLVYTLQSAIEPLVNAAVVHTETLTDREGEFGNKRLWGSVGFITGNLIAANATHVAGLEVVFPIFSAAMFLLALQAFLLRGVQMNPVSLQEMFRGLRRALGSPTYRWLLCFLVLWGIPFGGNSVAFGWFWTDIGGGSRGLGYIWFLAAVFEVPLYYLTVHFKQRISFRFLLLFSTTVAALRWLIYILAPQPHLLYFVQPLHAFMFVSLSVGAVYTIDQLSDPVIRSTGQALLVASVWGLGSALGNLSAGLIYGYFGPTYFYGFLIACNILGFLVLIYALSGLPTPAHTSMHSKPS